jgi:hypothetical protein
MVMNMWSLLVLFWFSFLRGTLRKYVVHGIGRGGGVVYLVVQGHTQLMSVPVDILINDPYLWYRLMPDDRKRVRQFTGNK